MEMQLVLRVSSGRPRSLVAVKLLVEIYADCWCIW